MDAGLTEAVVQLRAAVDALLAADVSAADGMELAACFAAVETERCRLEAVDHVLVAQLGEQQVAGAYGRASTAELLGELSRLSPGEARARVRAARDLGPRHDVIGLPLEPILAKVAAAQVAGQLSAAHARVIMTCLDALPEHRSWELAGPAEQFLVEQARHLDPKRLAAVARRLLATVDPDGAEPREHEQHRRRDLALTQLPDGSWSQSARLTEDTGAIWNALIDALSAPQPAEDGVCDQRTPGQRRHDAFHELGLRLLGTADLDISEPGTGGSPMPRPPATVNFTVGIDEFEARTGVAITESGNTVAMSALLRLADECELITTVVDRHGAVLCLGRSQRLANRAQRRALAARDGGCCFPGCTRPASWCQVHHVIPWIDGGRTDLDNLVLACGYHHREFERLGWIVQLRDGVPEWIPPPWLDASRTPRRNTAHHLPKIEFPDVRSRRPARC